MGMMQKETGESGLPANAPGSSGGSAALVPATEQDIGHREIRVKGKSVSVSSVQIDGRTVVVSGKWLRTAVVQDEELVEGESVPDPESFIARLKRSGLNADIFTFGQKLPDAVPHYSYRLEWDSLAVIPITTYSEWYQRFAKSDVRIAVKKAGKRGLVTREAEFDDPFVQGIVSIYNETPIRQGKPFWHYGKDFTAVKQISSTYLERSIFVGAYFNNELVGFIKMVRVGSLALTLHVISMMKHFDKKATNALIAKAVEICADKGMSHLVYGNFLYGDGKNSLTEFKERNGFQEVLIPRYYLPMTRKGEMALAMGLHHGAGSMLPRSVRRAMLNARTLVWKLRRKI
jgi:hypothetical protein